MRHIRKREVVILLTMSIVLVILGNAFSVFAATSSELKNQQQNNQKQIDGPIDAVCNLGDLEAKFTAFGWTVLSANGNKMKEKRRQFRKAVAF